MDLDRALRIFKLYRYHMERDPSQAEAMLLTDCERDAIKEIEKVARECSASNGKMN